METAAEYIEGFKKLAPDQKQIVIEFVASTEEEEEYIEEENYSPEDIAKILKAGEEAKQGINMSGPFVGKEANEHLQRLMRKS